jgi:hypothetical protein
MKLCWIGYHRKLRWAVNPASDNTEPQCRACGKFVYYDQTPWLKAERFE